MKTTYRNFILFTTPFFLVTLLINGFAFAQEPCQPESCNVSTNKDSFDIAIMPDSLGGPFPIEVDGVGYCGPNADDSPCLLWRYQCIGSDCNNIGKVWAQIPISCKNPIEILWTSEGDPINLITFCADSNNPGLTCDSYGLRLTPVAGGPGELFWFTTSKEVEYNVIDVIAQLGSLYKACKSGIAGPGYKEKLPEVRVEPRVQCYQFTAETDCAGPQTWYAEWTGSEPCAVDVWAAQWEQDVDGNYIPVSCDQVKTVGTLLTAEPLGDISIEVSPGQYQILTEALINNSECDEGWLRFVDQDTGCNLRCYYSGGRRYCIE